MNMETTTIKVSGMSCGGCVKSVTNVLPALPGVGKAEVTLQPGEARVEFDPAQVTREAMARAIDDAGFEAS
jgi:copper chaperone